MRMEYINSNFHLKTLILTLFRYRQNILQDTLSLGLSTLLIYHHIKGLISHSCGNDECCVSHWTDSMFILSRPVMLFGRLGGQGIQGLGAKPPGNFWEIGTFLMP